MDRVPIASVLEAPPGALSAKHLRMLVPFQKRRRGIETKIIFGHQAPKTDEVLLRRMARGWGWWTELRSGRATLKEIVKRERLSRRFVAIHIDLAFLAPDIVRDILEGRQAPSLNAQAFRARQLPDLWSEQRRILAQWDASAGV